MSEFRMMYHDEAETDVISCDCCHYPAPLAEFNVTALGYLSRTGQRKKRLCELCAGSMAGQMWEYSEMHPGYQIAGVICHVGNALLERLRNIERDVWREQER